MATRKHEPSGMSASKYVLAAGVVSSFIPVVGWFTLPASVVIACNMGLQSGERNLK